MAGAAKLEMRMMRLPIYMDNHATTRTDTEIVLVDSPPVLAVSDPLIIGAVVDGGRAG